MRASMELPDYVGRFRVIDLVGEGAMGALGGGILLVGTLGVLGML